MVDVERTFGQISWITWRSIWNQLKIAHANNFKVNENLILTRDLKFRRVDFSSDNSYMSFPDIPGILLFE